MYTPDSELTDALDVLDRFNDDMDADTQFDLAMFHLSHMSQNRDVFGMALDLLEAAAQQEHLKANYVLRGINRIVGEVVERDFEEAIAYFRHAGIRGPKAISLFVNVFNEMGYVKEKAAGKSAQPVKKFTLIAGNGVIEGVHDGEGFTSVFFKAPRPVRRANDTDLENALSSKAARIGH